MKKNKTAFIVSITLWASAALLPAQTTVAINPGTQYQTFRGWGGLFSHDLEVSDRLTRQIIDIGINDLGATCFRYEPPGGWYPETRRWEWENDDADPLHTDWSALSTNDLDERVTKWVLPVRQAIEANGDRMYVQISPSFYNTGSSGEAFPWFLRSPGEYMEYAMSVILRLKNVHGIEPDTYTICNEPQYYNDFSESITLQMAKALGRRMQETGLRTGIQYPESMSDASAIIWLQNAQNDPELWKYVRTISYHLYGPRTNLEGIRDIGLAKGIPTAQTEFMTGNSLADDYLYNDMTQGGVSEWHTFGQIFPVSFANGTSFDRKAHYWLFRQFMPYVRPGAVRVDSVSVDSTVRPLAFTKNGETTVLLINTMTASSNQTVTLSGLPNGQYGVCQSISEALPTELGLQTVTNGQLSLFLAKNAFMTIYPHNSGNLAPLVLQWLVSDSYLTPGVKTSTTLSVDAMDPELDTLSYQWSIVTNPPGTSVVFATPTNKSCAVSGLAAEGEYVFAVTVSDATHSKTREVIIKSFNGNQPPILFDVHQRIPVRIIQPASSTTLRAAAKDVEGSACTLLWSVVSQPSGASAVLTDPTNSACVISNLTVVGDYTVRVTASDGTDVSSEDLSFSVYPQDVNPPVISNLSGTLNGNGSGHLSATTSDADGHWISHWWEQTSGPANAKTYFSAQSSPVSEVYADTAGSYQFRLITVGPNQYANSATVTLNLSATAAPSAAFTAAPLSGWAPLTVTFTDTSSGTVTNRYWDFGDGFTTNTAAASIAHVYTSAATRTVTLIVSGPNGSSTNTQTDCVRALVSIPPSAGFSLSPASGTAPLTVTFTDTSTGSITNRYWDFGDGAVTNTFAASISHTYSFAGTNTVQLIVNGPLGASTNTQSGAVIVTAPVAPTANFTASPVSGTAPLTVTFTDTSTGSITGRFWSFGDGGTTNTTATSVSHAYISAGTNTVQLIVNGPAGASTNTQANLISVAAAASAGTLLVYDPFSDSVSGSVVPAGWISGTPGVGEHSRIDAGSLTCSGLAVSAGNSFGLGQGTADYYRDFTATSLAVGETVYYSFLLRLNSPLDPFNSGYFRMFNTAAATASGITVGFGTTDYTTGKMGFSINNRNRNWIHADSIDTPETYTAADTTYLVVAGYTRGSAAANGSVTLWINPSSSSFGTSTPPPATVLTNSYASVGVWNRLEFISNGSLAGVPNWQIDELRIGTNWAAVVPSPGIPPGDTDDDDDGLPNEWETKYFGGATNANPNAPAANGINTILEAYIADLDPTNAQSVFTVSNNWNILSWGAASGRVYAIYGTTNLLNGFQPLETNILWPQSSWTGQVSGAPGEFYKIKVQLAP